jgi:hypothetical protein
VTQRGPGRATCGLTFQAGRYVGPGSGPYRICLSESQTLDLFGVPWIDPERAAATKLGCGSWACVWERSDGRAVKITRDVDDIAAFQAAGVVKGVPGRPVPHVVRVFKQRELIGAGVDIKTGKKIKLYGQVAQKVDPITPQLDDWIKNRMCRMRISLLTDVQRHRSEKLPNKTFLATELTRDKVAKACVGLVRGKRQKCQRFGNQLIDTFESLYRRGVYWVDMNENNIGIDEKTGQWYGFDLGISDVPLKQRPRELRGAPARCKRR